MSRTTEQAARETITGLFTELAELCDPMNDDNLAAWEMARQKAAEVFHATDTVCVQLAVRRGLNAPALPASTAVFLKRPMTAREFLDRLLIPVETPEEAEELDRIERAHPVAGLHPVMSDLMRPFVQRKPA